MEKFGQLHAQAVDEERTWDLIIVDTPPSRSALDFLDAPERLSSMLDGRFIKLLLAPAKGPAKLLTAGFGIVTGALNKVLGAQVLTDMQTSSPRSTRLFGGFRQRAEGTYALLQADETAFVVVASPEPAAMREASYFVERLGGAERLLEDRPELTFRGMRPRYLKHIGRVTLSVVRSSDAPPSTFPRGHGGAPPPDPRSRARPPHATRRRGRRRRPS